MNNLRNCILIALAFDASPAEIEHAHTVIDRVYGPNGNAGGVDPAYLVSAEVPATANGVTAHGQSVVVNNAGNLELAPETASPSVDNTGMPWDERIHSSSKTITEKGVWRAKRGVNPDTAKRIEAEIRASLPNADRRAHEVAPPVNTPPALPGAGLPALPGANVAPVVDPAYTAFVNFVATNTQSPANPTARFNEEFVKGVLTYYGVAEGSLQNLAHNPALIPQIEAYMRSQLG